MRKFLLTTLLLINCYVHSQEHYNSQGYDVTNEDLTERTYTNDESANALVLYESVNVFAELNFEFKDRYELKKNVVRKVKILDDAGINCAIHTIPLYNNELASEKVESIEVITHNLENNTIETTELNPDFITTEKYNKHRSALIINPTNVKTGSVITYRYTIVSPFMTHLDGWIFQEDIPKLQSTLELSVPQNFEYHAKVYGDIYLTDSETTVKEKCFSIQNTIPTVLANSPYLHVNCLNSYFLFKNIPAFKEEAYALSKTNSLVRIDFELKRFTSISGKVTDYSKFFGDFDEELRKSNITNQQLTKSQFNKVLPAEIISEPDKFTKAEKIFRFIQNNYKWNETHNIVESVTIDNLIENKSGNAQSINLLLLNLLNESGIKAKPVILSTRDNGLISKINPDLSDFNYLIVQANINKKTYLLDASSPYLNFGEIPFKCLNQYGMRLDSKRSFEWIDLKPFFPTHKLYNVKIDIDASQKVKGSIQSKKTGYHALNSKQAYFSSKQKYTDLLKQRLNNKTIADHKVVTTIEDHDFTESFIVNYTIETPSQTISINPIVIKFIEENPLKLENRIYPIDFGFKDNFLYMAEINLNDHYTIKSVPEDSILELSDNGGSIAWSSKVIGNTINIMFKINLNQAIYQPEDYQTIKEFMNKIIEIQNNANIVLERK